MYSDIYSYHAAAATQYNNSQKSQSKSVQADKHAVKCTLYSLSLSKEKLHIQESSGVLYSWVQTASHSKRVFIFRLVVSCMMTCTDIAKYRRQTDPDGGSDEK